MAQLRAMQEQEEKIPHLIFDTPLRGMPMLVKVTDTALEKLGCKKPSSQTTNVAQQRLVSDI
jgi:hypothetical protein